MCSVCWVRFLNALQVDYRIRASTGIRLNRVWDWVNIYKFHGVLYIEGIFFFYWKCAVSNTSRIYCFKCQNIPPTSLKRCFGFLDNERRALDFCKRHLVNWSPPTIIKCSFSFSSLPEWFELKNTVRSNDVLNNNLA